MSNYLTITAVNEDTMVIPLHGYSVPLVRNPSRVAPLSEEQLIDTVKVAVGMRTVVTSCIMHSRLDHLRRRFTEA
jgi:hypothetical protein